MSSGRISVLVLTRNEERDLPGCLESVAWCNDIVVLDSYSVDRTVAIAEAYGARVVQRAFDGYASQRNAGLAAGFAHPWVFVLDADERPSRDLVEEMQSAVESASDVTCGFRMQRRDYFMGRWLKHAQASAYYIRLLRLGRARYEREVNEIARVDGEIRDLQHHLDHFPFSKGLEHWFHKHNLYSTMEAAEVLRSRRGHVPFSLAKAFFERDFNERRFHQKELFYRMPVRPILKFMLLYVWKGGFLDGRAGYTYARLQAIYELMIVLKTDELTREARESD
jgi:glycosyltransferase involved in cell wall biosynthesis